MSVLGDDLTDFFFGCNIREITSKPITNKTPLTRRDESEHMDKFEPPLKTISVWLDIPVSTGENAVKAIKV